MENDFLISLIRNMLSIIIPTKNEERYLPKLLDSIKLQCLSDLEIIVSDAHSIDKTRDIALGYGCRIVDGGEPSFGRNNGAKYSKGEMLIFIDADSIFPPYFLKKGLQEFYDRNLDVAGTLQAPIPTGRKIKDIQYKFFIELANKFMKLTQYTKRPFMQSCMFAKKEIHEKLGGFDEELVFGEDSDYAKRAKTTAKGKFGILETPGKVWFNMRRFENEGIKVTLKNVYFITSKFLGYEFRKDSRIKYFN
jgi:glycosyltransferase involved in cell wall biosynthesis